MVFHHSILQSILVQWVALSMHPFDDEWVPAGQFVRDAATQRSYARGADAPAYPRAPDDGQTGKVTDRLSVRPAEWLNA
jgi:hypothetical protein